MKEEQSIVNNLLEERTTRAVERIFSENSPEQINNIFNCLQNRIRNSSNELRQTLYRKYESLINCSELLESLYLYAKDLNDMSNNMRQIIKQTQLEEEEDVSDSLDKIKQIQREVQKHNYLKAIEKCNQYKASQKREQAYYMDYLEIEVLEKLEKYLLTTKLNKRIVEQSMETIRKFIQFNPISKIQRVIEKQSKSLLSKVCSYLPSLTEEFNENQLQKAIISGLFQFKVASLTDYQNDEEIQQYFSNLLQICKQSSECSRLGEILKSNNELLQSNLIMIFIQNDEQGLKFQYQLYHRLISSNSFSQVLVNLEAALYPQGGKWRIMDIFQKLWSNYHQQVIEYVANKISPLSYLQKISTLQQQQQIPSQISKYITNNKLKLFQQIFSIRKQYEEQILPLIINNMNSLCQRGNNSQIITMYQQKIHQLNQLIKNHIFGEYNQVNFRRYILMHLLCESYNCHCLVELKLSWSQLELQPPHIISPFAALFQNPSLSFQTNMIELDMFFIGYTIPYLQAKDLTIIQKIVIDLLNQLKESLTSNQSAKERLNYTIGKFKKHNQPLSIHRELLIGIGRHIFQIQYSNQQIKLDTSFCRYLCQDDKQNNNEIGQESFEIGQKEAGEDMVSIGVKKVTNIISGFMKKK